MSQKLKKIKLSTVLLSLPVLVGIYLVFAVVSFYGFETENKFIRKTLEIFYLPAAFVNGLNPISVKEVENNLALVKQFYENPDFANSGYRVDFSTEDGAKRLKIKEKNLLNKLIENKVIEILAKKKGIILDSDVVARELDTKIEQYGTSREILEKLKSSYGWDITDFKKKIVEPAIYKKSLEEDMKKNNPGVKAAKEKIDRAFSELKSGQKFEEVAKKYSEGESAENGGSLGWFSYDQMIPEIAVATSILKNGEISPVLESSLGYHIVSVEDKKTENSLTMVRIRQIFVKTKNFSDWLLEEEKRFKIYVLLPNFYWDKETQEVRFRDKSLEEFEKKVTENPEGDISVMF
jgi:hypothetical protein